MNRKVRKPPSTALVLRLRRAGMSPAQIARMLDTDRDAVAAVIREAKGSQVSG